MAQSASLIDISSLPDWAKRAVLDTVERVRSGSTVCARNQSILNMDERSILAWAEDEYPGVPMGLSSWYSEVATWQETALTRSTGLVKTRPVFMRGAKECRVMRNALSLGSSSANGWAALVFWRALKMSRRTFLDYDEFQDFSEQIKAALRRRYRLTLAFDDRTTVSFKDWYFPQSEREFIRIVGGRKVFLTPNAVQHITSLHAIVRKAERLDDQVRRALVKASMLERLAA